MRGGQPVRGGRRWRGPIAAGAAAAILGGVPSTVLALAARRDPLDAVRAAGTLLPGRRDRPESVPAGVAVHLLVSAAWTAVLHGVGRRHRLGPVGGAAAGVVIALLDLELIGRAYPAIRGLPRCPQWLDHLAFGAIVGACASRRDSAPTHPRT